MGERWMKREVAEHLLNAAGSLVEFWSEDADRAEIPADFARECIARWLKDLPGDSWDTRLGECP